MGDDINVASSSSDLCKGMKEVSLEDKSIKKFTFSEETFSGKRFYEKYKDAAFLQIKRNITKILSQGDELQQILKTMKSGEVLIIDGMFLKSGVPLVIKKNDCIDESDVSDEDITFRRLTGLVAAYIWNNNKQFDAVYASEPEALGMSWAESLPSRKLYLSAVSGAEYFEEFEYVPFICALRKYQKKTISQDLLINIAMIPNSVTGEPMAVSFRRNYWKNTSYSDRLFGSYSGLKDMLRGAPNVIKNIFQNL